ncbi:hypothetical protein GQ600_13283 [Phytophthora cactorum]|nr:hypothetical protein GQ600_13283 [Phytophthora cactorum]
MNSLFAEERVAEEVKLLTSARRGHTRIFSMLRTSGKCELPVEMLQEALGVAADRCTVGIITKVVQDRIWVKKGLISVLKVETLFGYDPLSPCRPDASFPHQKTTCIDTTTSLLRPQAARPLQQRLAPMLPTSMLSYCSPSRPAARQHVFLFADPRRRCHAARRAVVSHIDAVVRLTEAHAGVTTCDSTHFFSFLFFIIVLVLLSVLYTITAAIMKWSLHLRLLSGDEVVTVGATEGRRPLLGWCDIGIIEIKFFRDREVTKALLDAFAFNGFYRLQAPYSIKVRQLPSKE